MTIWAFLSPSLKTYHYCELNYQRAMEKLTQSVRNGESRFGWSSESNDDLRDRDNWDKDDWHRNRLQLFLLDVKKDDWIVHINLPEWGKCIAVKVLGTYSFDDGIDFNYGTDFRHNFEVDPSTIVEFWRNDPNVVPNVNLSPRYRHHKIYNKEDFVQTLKNLSENRVELDGQQTSPEYHLKKKTSESLEVVTKLIHEMHRGKKLETFLAKVINKVPGVVDVVPNGMRFGTDHGADLIVTMKSSFGNLQLEHKIIVQIKSYDDVHEDTSAVDEVKTGIRQYSGTAGMIITTAESSENLENEIQAASEELECPIDLIASEDVARLAIKHAPELVFDLDNIS